MKTIVVGRTLSEARAYAAEQHLDAVPVSITQWQALRGRTIDTVYLTDRHVLDKASRAFKESLAVSTITAPSRTMWTPAGVVDVLA